MGLDINVKKPVRFLGAERPDNEDVDYVCLYTLDFKPIEHLPKFRRGYWEYELSGDASYSSAYGTFANFREAITLTVYGCGYKEFIRQLGDGERVFSGAFIEMLWFADNEGDFDYQVAGKLLDDFQKWRDAILANMESDFLKKCLKDYMSVLEECVNCKGVVDYH